MPRDCALRIAGRGRSTSFFMEYKTGNQSLFECAESFTKVDLRYICHYAVLEVNMSSCHSLRGWNKRYDEVLGPADQRDVIQKTSLRTSSNDQSSRRPPHHASVLNGATHEETGLQRNGTRLYLATRARDSRPNLSSDDNRVRVWRTCDKHLNHAFALQRYTASTAGVLVLGVIVYNTLLPLVLIRGTLTAQRYVHDILQCHVLTLMQRLNTMIGLTRQGYYKTLSALLLPFLLLLVPRLSPIELIFDHLGRRVGHPTTLNELEARVQQLWNKMSQDIIQNLNASMLDRIASCICARAVLLKLWSAPPWGGAMTLRREREHIENKRFKK
ncbi:transposable element Tcb2 transposase [Trichonephila clavipes]|nr:transposable element Tcb2 transposase [Trichonephila clavipes]